MERLSEIDILDLIDETESGLRKLQFKAETAKDLLEKLKNMLQEKKEEENQRKSEILVRSTSQVVINPNENVPNRKPYPLSDWDKAIIGTLKEKKRVMISNELLDEIIKKAKEEGFFKDYNHAKIKLNQCLVKLANRRNDLVKLHHRGRGFAYALPDWMGGNQLKEEYYK